MTHPNSIASHLAILKWGERSYFFIVILKIPTLWSPITLGSLVVYHRTQKDTQRTFFYHHLSTFFLAKCNFYFSSSEMNHSMNFCSFSGVCVLLTFHLYFPLPCPNYPLVFSDCFYIHIPYSLCCTRLTHLVIGLGPVVGSCEVG